MKLEDLIEYWKKENDSKVKQSLKINKARYVVTPLTLRVRNANLNVSQASRIRERAANTAVAGIRQPRRAARPGCALESVRTHLAVHPKRRGSLQPDVQPRAVRALSRLDR